MNGTTLRTVRVAGTGTVDVTKAGYSTPPVEILRVGSGTDVHKLAGATAGCLRDAGAVELQAIGAGAVNQAVKALAIARSFLLDEGLSLAMVPVFATVERDGLDVTALRFVVQLVRR